LNDVIRDANGTLNYYQRKQQKWVDTLETYVCPDTTVGGCVVTQVLEILVADLEPFIASLQENITVLQSYLSFPRDFILLKKQLADYIRTLSCWLDTFTELLGGWLITIQDQIIGYIEVYYTIIEVIKSVEELLDVFTNFEDNCDICTNERFGNFGWASLLGLVIPEIPIVKFPKWPDIVVDLSDLKAQIVLEVPTIHFVLEPIKMPKIPRIPLPDIPNINDLELLLQLPKLPVLPRLPKLPELPELPAIPVIDLPTLPPPPKLPDLGASFEVILPLLEQILNAWCLVKKAFAPVPEAYLKDHIVLLTNRPSYMIPLDMLKPKIGDISALESDFNELRIEAKVHLGLRIAGALEAVEKAATEWNSMDTDLAGWMDREIIKAIQAMKDAGFDLSAIEQGINDFTNAAENFDTIIEDAWDETVQGAVDEWGEEWEDFDEKYFRGAEDSMQQWSDDATEAMGEWTESANRELANAVESIDGALDGFQEAAIQAVRSEIGGIVIRLMISPELALAEWGMEELITVLEENNINPDSIQNELDHLDQTILDWYKCVALNECPSEEDDQALAPPVNQTDAIVKKTQDEFSDRLSQLTKSIEQANKNPVDYTVLKEKYNIPDYRMMKRLTAMDKIEAVRDELLEYSNQLEFDAIEVGESDNAFAVIHKQVDAPLPFALAKKSSDPEDQTIFSSAVNSRRLAQVPTNLQTPRNNTLTKNAPSQSPSSSGPCVGSCLIDPATNQSVQFIPHFDNPATTKTGFIPAAPGESHVLYSDADSLYLKENLAVLPNITTNIPPRVPNIIFNLDHFISI
ncbi:hypothetical protein KAR91_68795, partial [Candidatus Pacearchaeota archaeon]|nr:hypothetical protein [Candidatus Pacearchaeota archaeon]